MVEFVAGPERSSLHHRGDLTVDGGKGTPKGGFERKWIDRGNITPQ